MEKRKLEDLNLLDDFLFGAMVNHPEIGENFVRELLRVIFKKDFGSLTVIPQKVYPGTNTDKHGARLDVFIEEDATTSLYGKYDSGKCRNRRSSKHSSDGKLC